METIHAITTANSNMVEGQLRPNRVSDRHVLARFVQVDRAAFVPAGTPNAYVDQPIAYGPPGREMYSPLVVGHLVQALGFTPESRVLVLAGGSGYTAALLAPLAGHVTVCEEDASLLQHAQKNLKGAENVSFLHRGPADAPGGTFSHIVVDCAFSVLPKGLINHVVEGGKLAGVYVPPAGVPRLVVRTRHGNSWVEEALFETQGTIHPALVATEHFEF